MSWGKELVEEEVTITEESEVSRVEAVKKERKRSPINTKKVENAEARGKEFSNKLIPC